MRKEHGNQRQARDGGEGEVGRQGQVNGQPKVRGKFKGVRRTANFGWEYRVYEWAAIVPKKKTARFGRRRGHAFQERDNIEERTQGETQVPRSHRAPEEGDQGGEGRGEGGADPLRKEPSEEEGEEARSIQRDGEEDQRVLQQAQEGPLVPEKRSEKREAQGGSSKERLKRRFHRGRHLRQQGLFR